MSTPFFDQPILNSPYTCPSRHRELDASGQTIQVRAVRPQRDGNGEPQLHLFGQLKRITRQWLDTCLQCQGGTYPAQLKYKMLADRASERIMAGINRALSGDRPVKAILDPYNPVGSTAHVRFTTSKTDRWRTAPDRCHIDWVILDSDWEGEFCRVAEAHPPLGLRRVRRCLPDRGRLQDQCRKRV